MTTTTRGSSSKATNGRTETAARKRAGEDRLAELHRQIPDGVAALVDSQAWRAMLDTAARFHRYSLNNLLLIAVQAPGATRVAGFRSWQSLGPAGPQKGAGHRDPRPVQLPHRARRSSGAGRLDAGHQQRRGSGHSTRAGR